MSAEATIYDFERIISTAAAQVFTNAGLDAFTVYSDPKFQKARPRVEVVFRAGGEASPKREAIMIDGSRRASAFKGELSLHAITDPTPTGKNTHGEYRAKVRSIAAVLHWTINETLLANHKVNWMVETTTSHGIRTQDGYEQSTITFAVDFSVQANAWTGDFTVPVLAGSSVPTWWVMDWIAQTYNLATAGTNAVMGDQALAQAAYDIAVNGTNAADQSYSLAQQALEAAWAGTNAELVPPWVMDWLAQTYNIATAGTDAAAAALTAAHGADSWARDAFGIAVSGTNAANAAWDYAGQAWTIAVAGTDAAHSADSWARDAYGLAVAGTNAAATAQQGVNETNLIARDAWSLAIAGTNAAAIGAGLAATDLIARVALSTAWAGTDAAHEADMWGRDAFSLAVDGTNAAAAASAAAATAQTGVNETNLIARDGWSLAISGTNAAAAASASALNAQTGVNATSLIARDAWSLAIVGTNAVAATDVTANVALTTSWAGTTAAHEADSWARDAYSIAVTGTNAVNATDVTARVALSAAWAGTNAGISIGRVFMIANKMFQF
jgi:hypothetical protein